MEELKKTEIQKPEMEEAKKTEKTEDTKDNEKGNSKWKKLFVLLLLLVIIVLGVIIYFLLNKPEEKDERDISEGLVVGEVDEKAANATFTTDMNMIWNFPSGSAVSTNAQIGNSTSNLYECYFELFLDDEEQTLLYSSPVLPVGKRLDKLELNEVLPDGAHEAVCIFHILDDEDPDRELGTVSFAVSLMVVKE